MAARRLASRKARCNKGLPGVVVAARVLGCLSAGLFLGRAPCALLLWHDFANSGPFNYALSAEYHNAENIVALEAPRSLPSTSPTGLPPHLKWG